MRREERRLVRMDASFSFWFRVALTTARRKRKYTFSKKKKSKCRANFKPRPARPSRVSRRAHYDGADGSFSVKTQPFGRFARTLRSPPIARANDRAVQSPMPKPPLPDVSTVRAR